MKLALTILKELTFLRPTPFNITHPKNNIKMKQLF